MWLCLPLASSFDEDVQFDVYAAGAPWPASRTMALYLGARCASSLIVIMHQPVVIVVSFNIPIIFFVMDCMVSIIAYAYVSSGLTLLLLYNI